MKKYGKIFLFIIAMVCFVTAFKGGDIKVQAGSEADFYRKETDVPYSDTDFYDNYYSSVPTCCYT